MQELEQKISKLLQEEQPITESEAQDLATLIYNLPEIKGGRVGAGVKPANGGKEFLETKLINNGNKWVCDYDAHCMDEPEPLKTLKIDAKNFIKGTRIEIYAPITE